MSCRKYTNLERSEMKRRRFGSFEAFRAMLTAESGAAAVYFVLSAPVWVAGLGFGAEVGIWYAAQQHLQSTADTVAESVAGRVGTGASAAELTNLANYVLTNSRFEFASGTWDMSVSSSGPVFVDGTSVEVTLTRTVPRLLTSFFRDGDVVLSARATARVWRATPGCVLALDRDDDLSFRLDAAANVTLTGCEALANSTSFFSFSVPWGARMTVDCARTAGFFQIQGQLNVSCQQGRQQQAGFTLDPYVDYPEPDVNGLTCGYDNQNFTVTPTSGPPPNHGYLPNGARYYYFCNGATLTVAGSATVSTTIPGPALYIFDRNSRLVINDNFGVVSGNNSYYFRNGSSVELLAPTTRVQFSAPATGPYRGMLFFGSRTNPNGVNNQIVVGANSRIQGAIYFPTSGVVFQAAGAVAGCLQVIANTVRLNGAWQAAGPCTVPGARPMVASRIVRLTQ